MFLVPARSLARSVDRGTLSKALRCRYLFPTGGRADELGWMQARTHTGQHGNITIDFFLLSLEQLAVSREEIACTFLPPSSFPFIQLQSLS